MSLSHADDNTVFRQVVLLINDYRPADEALGHAVVHSAPFWLVVVLTISIILPWLRLRKVPVRAEVLSDHCVRLYFDYGAFPDMSHAHSLTGTP